MQSVVRVTTPPEVEPVAISELRQHCRIDHDSDDGLLALYLASARSLAEQFLARALVTQGLTWSMSVAAPPSSSLNISGLIVVPDVGPWPGSRVRSLAFPRAPVQTVVGVMAGFQDGSTVALTEGVDFRADFVADPGHLTFTASALVQQAVNLSVEFMAGYGDAGTDVPAEIRIAVMMWAAHLYEHRGDANVEMPRAVESLLWPKRIMHFG